MKIISLFQRFLNLFKEFDFKACNCDNCRQELGNPGYQPLCVSEHFLSQCKHPPIKR
jgi:hypothetical protein